MPHFVLLIPPVAPTEGVTHYYWVLLKWLHEFKGAQTTVFLPSIYLDEEIDGSRWELSEWSLEFHDYKFVDPKSTKTEFVRYEKKLSDSLSEESPLERFASYIKRDIPGLFQYFLEEFSGLKKQHSEVVLVTWLNCPSMRSAAAAVALPLVFNEIGPLRKPNYTQCAYWDVSGVNGDTEVNVRWCREKDDFYTWLRTKDEVWIADVLESLFISEAAVNMFNSSKTSHALGIALQVETDSNIIAFSKGWNNLSLLELGKKACISQPPLIRYHPNGKALYADCVVDLEQSPVRFLGAIQELWTINSSLGIEAVLWRRKVKFFGETPIDLFFNSDEETSDRFRLWFFLSYLVPYSLLFSADYYTWRLSNPTIVEIAEKHLVALGRQGRNKAGIDVNTTTIDCNRVVKVSTPTTVLNELVELRGRCCDQENRIAEMHVLIQQMTEFISGLEYYTPDQSDS